MFIKTSDLTRFAKTIIVDNFPHYRRVYSSYDMNGNYYVNIVIDDADYIADVLTCDMNFREISDQIEDLLLSIGANFKSVTVRRGKDDFEEIKDLYNILALGC